MLKIFIIISCFLLSISYAQNNKNVLTHIVKQGDNLTVISILYKVSVKDIYILNNINDKSIINIGQKLLIPMGEISYAKEEVKAGSSKPQAHQIESGESLYKIAKTYNVSVQQLRQWNNLENDYIRVGDYLYLTQQKSSSKVEAIANAQETFINTSIAESEKLKENKAKVVDVVIEKPESKISVDKTSEKIVIHSGKHEESFFEKQYISANKYHEGNCGVFKTITGWKDKKYYALMNDAPNGSIVKVMVNDTYIYAKVLGPLPNIKEDNNLLIRVSNAAAAALGISNDLASVKVEL